MGSIHHPLAGEIFIGLRFRTIAGLVFFMARHRACDCAVWYRLCHCLHESTATLVNRADRIAWKIAWPNRYGMERLSRSRQLECPVPDSNQRFDLADSVWFDFAASSSAVQVT